jgi:hypothetical protein
VKLVGSQKGKHKNRVVVLCNSRHGDRWRAGQGFPETANPVFVVLSNWGPIRTF